MSDVKIEKSIPPPEPKASKYPWAEMQPGDSIFLAGKEGRQGGSYAAAARGVTGGGKWTSRAVTEGEIKGIRIWRVE
jgi:hypothetical protein